MACDIQELCIKKSYVFISSHILSSYNQEADSLFKNVLWYPKPEAIACDIFSLIWFNN